MCGIVGVVDFDGGRVEQPLLRRMCSTLRHRGPDDHGVVCLPSDHSACGPTVSVGLGSQRLSIIDVAHGHQPMANTDRSVWVVFNGEVYNFTQLRTELERDGHVFSTQSDTEVIIHAYEQWGETFVESLDGMFAFALWDARNERLILGRDRFGQKPLVYADLGTRLIFASELQALLCAPEVPRELDLGALGNYLAYMAIPAPQTIYRHVRKVRPAHQLVRDRRGTRTHQYWSMEFEPKLKLDRRDAAERVSELLTAAVRKRLVSEVPLGVFLSGGLDSSAVAAIMAGLSDAPIKTFSIGFDEPEYNELPYARRVARVLGSEHHEFVVQPDAVEVLPSLVQRFGEPFADSSVIPTSYLAAMSREHVTVALNGDGGDELFAGYGRHLATRMVEDWQRVLPFRRWLKQVGDRLDSTRLSSHARQARFARLFRAVSATRADRYRLWAGVFGPDLIATLGRGIPPGEGPVPGLFTDVMTSDAVDAMLAVDSAFYLPTDLLVKVDIATMMHSLEARSPFLDRDLAEFSARLPSNLKLRRFTSKAVLKDALKNRLPAETLHRPKRGFAVPIARWLRTNLKDFLSDHLQPSGVATSGLIQQRAVDELIAAHQSGAADYSHHLWTLLMLELWHRAFMTA